MKHMSGRLQKHSGRVQQRKAMLLGGESSPQTRFGLVWSPLRWELRGALLFGGTLLPRRPPRRTKPSWSLHLSSHPEIHPHPTAVPRLGCTSRCRSGSFWQEVHPSSFHPSRLCLPPSAARRDDSHRPNPICPHAGTAQTWLGSPTPTLRALVPELGRRRRAGIRIAASGRNFQPLTLISSRAS